MKRIQPTFQLNSNLCRICAEDAAYPSVLHQYLGEQPPHVITALGNIDIIQGEMLALFCSLKCPGNLILQTYDLARTLRDAGITVIGGFHSPMEQECLSLLLRGKQPIIICPARSLEGMRIPTEWKQPLAEGRLLLLSPFEEKHQRATADLAQKRNELVAALANEIFIAYAAPGSKTEAFAGEVSRWGKSVLTFEGAANAALIQLGVRPVSQVYWHKDRV